MEHLFKDLFKLDDLHQRFVQNVRKTMMVWIGRLMLKKLTLSVTSICLWQHICCSIGRVGQTNEQANMLPTNNEIIFVWCSGPKVIHLIWEGSIQFKLMLDCDLNCLSRVEKKKQELNTNWNLARLVWWPNNDVVWKRVSVWAENVVEFWWGLTKMGAQLT